MEIIEPVLYIALSQTFFAGLLVSTARPSTIPNKLISAFLFMIFFDLLFALVKLKFIVFYSFPFVAFTYGPIIYLYVVYITRPALPFRIINYLHFIPFVLFFAASVIFREDRAFTDLSGYLIADHFIPVRISYGICFFASLTVYSVLTFIRISNHQKGLSDFVSYHSGRVTLNWLKIISISLYAVFVVLFILGGITLFISFLPFDPYYTVFILVAILSFVYSFYAIRQPGLVGIVFANGKKDTLNDYREDRYKRSGLSKARAKEYLDFLLEYMDKEKPYLERDLNINRLSQLTGIKRHHITEVLNEVHGVNFFNFVNKYRVNEVLKRLNDPANKSYTILAIAYDSGFNSKSTFNAAFRQQTGTTPSHYLKKSKTDN